MEPAVAVGVGDADHRSGASGGEVRGTAGGRRRLRGVPVRAGARGRGAAAKQLPPRLPPWLPGPVGGARPEHLPALPGSSRPGGDALGLRHGFLLRRRRRLLLDRLFSSSLGNGVIQERDLCTLLC